MKTTHRSAARRWLCPWIMAILAGTFVGSVPLYAQGAKVSSPAELARLADQLKPGEWVWAPEVAPTGPILIYVDLSRQRATVYRNGVRIAVSTISSGKPGHETTTGIFTILQKDATHHSKSGSHVINLTRGPDGKNHWIYVGLPGHDADKGRELDEATLNRVHMPRTFFQDVSAILQPGATILVTQSSVGALTTGQHITILDSVVPAIQN